MQEQPSIVLTARDYALLEALAQLPAEPFAGAAEIIRHKLATALVVFPTDVAPDVVTLNSRVRFRIGSGPAQDRVRVAGPSEEVYGLTQILASPRGMALIGASAGDRVAARRRDGTVEDIAIEAVLFQPEQRRRPPLRVVAANPADVVLQAGWKRTATPAYSGDDDPGPSAA